MHVVLQVLFLNTVAAMMVGSCRTVQTGATRGREGGVKSGAVRLLTGGKIMG